VFDVYSSMRTIASDGVEVVVTDHGPEEGEPVLLIHGFPDSSRLWRHQIPILNEAGYRTLAPDLRGYGRSFKPTDVEDYEIGLVAGDMIAVLDDTGIETAHVVGHDWGGALGWFLAIAHPQRVRSLVAVSVGHPSAFRQAGYRQLEKTWYMLLFQFRGVAERWLSDDDWANLRGWTQGNSEIENWIEDLSRPGALTAALGLYRANMGPERLLRRRTEFPPVQVPVMGVWSSDDFALTEEQMTKSAGHVAGEFRYERIEGVSHWIPPEAPDELNRLLLDWYRSL
jgi:pimeloyl-ACP methyl ester carboxylesterase